MKKGVPGKGHPFLFVKFNFYERSEVKVIVEQSRETEGIIPRCSAAEGGSIGMPWGSYP
jgi:hypothetical protein